MKRFLSVFVSVFMCVLLCIPSVPASASGSGFFKAITSETISEYAPSAYVTAISPWFSRNESYFDGYDFSDLNLGTGLPVSPDSSRVLYALAGFNANSGNLNIVILDLSNTVGTYESCFVPSQGFVVAFDEDQTGSTYTAYNWIYNYSTKTWFQQYAASQGSPSRITDNYVITDVNAEPRAEEVNGETVYKAPVKNVFLPNTTDNQSWYITGGFGLAPNFMYANTDHIWNTGEFWYRYYCTDSYASSISNNFGVYMLNSPVNADLGGNEGATNFSFELTDYSNCLYWNGSEVVDPTPPTYVDYADTVTDTSLAFSDMDLLSVSDSNVSQSVNSRVSWALDGSSFDFDAVPDNWFMRYEVRIDFVIQCTFAGSNTKKKADMPGSISFVFEENLGNYSNIISGDKLLKISNLIDGTYGNQSVPVTNIPNNVQEFVRLIGTTQVAGDYSATYENMEIFVDELVNGNRFSENNGFHRVLSPVPHARDAGAGQVYSFSKLSWNVTLTAYNNVTGVRSRRASGNLDCISGQSNSQIEPAYTGDDVPVDKTYTSDDILVPDGQGGYYLVSKSEGSNISNNVVFPNELQITLVDDALKRFMEVMNTPAKNVQNTFWGFFGLFRDNPIADIYGKYFGFLPDGFKDYILALCGIGFGTTVFCACRRKLT